MINDLTEVISRQAAKYGDKEIIAYLDDKLRKADTYSWNRLHRDVINTACAFETLGLLPGHAVAIFTANRPEFLVTDFACYYNRAVPVSIYSTSSPQQVEYIINDCRAMYVCVGNQKQLDIVEKVRDHCPTLQKVILYDSDLKPSDPSWALTFADMLGLGAAASEACRAQVESRRRSVQPDDVATLIYTSGTTGEPKGAELTHRCFNTAMRIHRERLTMLSDQDTSLCFLPLSHIFEKGWTYVCLCQGIHITINSDPKRIADAIKMVRPTCMCSVPRFWEKVYAGIHDKMAAMSPLQQKVVCQAFKVGFDRNVNYVRLGKKVPWFLEKLYKAAEKMVFNKMKQAIGIENGNIFPTAGAPIAKHIVRFFRSMGVDMVVGYGLSETTATVTCFPSQDYVIGSVGTVMPQLEVRISPEGEIQVKGDTVMKGYHNKPEATAEAFTDDGWFRTGDAGYFDEEGALVLTERIKDLFKTSNGKYIAPQAIESRLGGDRFIEQVAVVGESRKYVTAIIIPAFDALKEYAKKKGINFKTLDDLIHNSEIIKMIGERIDKLQKGLANFEQIKKFTLLPKAFTIESGELTNTLKIRRPVINQHYAKEIEAMYA